MATFYPQSCLPISSIQAFLPTTKTFDKVILKNLVTPVEILSTSSRKSFETLIIQPSSISFELPIKLTRPAPENEFLFGLPEVYTKEQKTIVLIDYNEQKLPYVETQFAVLEDFYDNLLGQLSTFTKSDDAAIEYFSSIQQSTDYKAFSFDRRKYKNEYIKNINEIIAKGIFSRKILEGSSNV